MKKYLIGTHLKLKHCYLELEILVVTLSFEGKWRCLDAPIVDRKGHLSFAAAAVDEVVVAAVESGTYCLLVCWMVVAACWGYKMTAVDQLVVVMGYFVAAFDYGNLDSSFGCSCYEPDEALPLNEYCPQDPFDGTFQDGVASYHH